MTAHLLPLSALHAAGPGVLDVVFGPDGDFPGAPIWRGPLVSCGEIVTLDHLDALGIFVRSPEWVRLYRGRHDVALDCRVPSVAARLLKVCFMVPAGERAMIPFSRRQVDALLYGFGAWTEQDAAHVAALTLTLAPRIAALGGVR